MLQLLVLVFLCCVAAQEYPGKFQVDLVFPQNETYTPQAFFPVVYAVHNFKAAEGLNVYIAGEMQTSRAKFWEVDEPIGAEDFGVWSLPGAMFDRPLSREWPDTDPLFFITSMSPMTNGTETHFYIRWTVGMTNCTDDGEEDFRPETFQLEFSVALDGKLPDIAGAIRGCDYQSTATNVLRSYIGFGCGLVEESDIDDRCASLSEYADVVAANVSDKALDFDIGLLEQPRPRDMAECAFDRLGALLNL
ncbi:unnamed protein product [Parascedosporium putredinis]|uniref:DUF7136 domain-containing protein n=1 Tax=Parascedosporium putredinis TaxID=1442378 RepID=A0A9P1H6T3_9PEZI|nr:unnamed protein product [Parascedosporium putredinis]CAI7998938.1 unnamed protein product [Parascedosporium putredinis]